MRRSFTRILLACLCWLPLSAIAGGGPCNIALSHASVDETCPGFYDGSINLSVTGQNGNVTYLWSNGATSEDISSLTSGIYTVIATDGLGCMAFDTVVIGASYVLIVDLGPDTTYCDLSNFELLAVCPTANFFYWQDGSSDTSLIVTGPGLYSVYAQDANGCYDEDSVVLSQHPVPVPKIATTHPGCGSATGALDLTVSSGTLPFTFLWSTGATTEDLPSVALGNYSVVVEDSNGCQAETGTRVIAPRDICEYEIGSPIVCSSHTIQFLPFHYGLEFDGNDDYVEVPDIAAIRPSNEFTIEAWIMPSALSGPAQTVLEKRTNSEDGYSIRYDPLTRNLSVRLQNGPLLSTFTATTPLLLYQWSHVALVIQDSHVALYINGDLEQEVTYTGGVEPTVGTPLTIGGGPSRQSFKGRIDEVIHWNVALNAAEVGELSLKNLPAGMPEHGLYLNFNEAPGGATATDWSSNANSAHLIYMDTTNAWTQTNPMGMTYLWDFGDGTVNNSQAPFHGYLPRVWQTMRTTLTVTSDQGCQSSDTVNLPVHTPAVPFVNADTTSHYCMGDTVRLWVMQGYSAYNWSTGSTNDSITVLSSGLYVATALDLLGCVHTGSIPIHFNPNSTPAPVITPAGNLVMCEGDTVLLDVGGGYSYYLWNTGDTTSTLAVTDSGEFIVTVRNGFGCEHTSDTVFMTSLPAPSGVVIAVNDTLYAAFGTSYQWFLNGDSIPGAISNFFVPTSNGTYTVHVSGQGGCVTVSDPYSFAVGMAEEWTWGNAVVYPNPTQDQSTLKLNLRKAATLQWTLTDMSGKVLQTHSAKCAAGINMLKLPTDQLAKGIYLLSLTGAGSPWMTTVTKF